MNTGDFPYSKAESRRHTELMPRGRHRRRTKEQVAADLPAKQEQVLEIDLHPQHRKAYQTRLQRERQKVLGLIDDMNSNRFAIFRSLTVLRQLSLHAALVDEAHAGLASAKIDALLGQPQEARPVTTSTKTASAGVPAEAAAGRVPGYAFAPRIA